MPSSTKLLCSTNNSSFGQSLQPALDSQQQTPNSQVYPKMYQHMTDVSWHSQDSKHVPTHHRLKWESCHWMSP